MNEVALRRLPLMDSVRAIAAISIVVYHANGLQPTGFLGQVAVHLHVGVIVFFVITGTLLYRPFVARRLTGGPPPAIGLYVVRRLLRIVPAYWVALLVAVPVLGLTDVVTPTGVLKYFGFLQIYSPGGSQGIEQAWSLCVEMTFYAALPLFALAVGRTVRAQAMGIAGLAAVGLLWPLVATRAFGGDQLTTALFSLPNFLDEFACGMALALVSVHVTLSGKVPRAVRWVERHSGLCWALAGVCYVGVAIITGPAGAALGADGRQLAANIIPNLLATLIVLPAVFGATDQGRVRRLLATRVLTHLGVISYGIFLYHGIAFQQVASLNGGPRYWLFGLVLTFALAQLSWWLVESPMLRLKLRFGGRLPATPRSHPAAVSQVRV